MPNQVASVFDRIGKQTRMGIVQKKAFRNMIISYIGIVIGYVNKGVLFIWFLTTEQIGLVNLLVSLSLLFGTLAGLGSSYAIWKFFPFLRNPEKKHHGFLLLMLLISCIGGLLFTVITLIFQPEIAANYQEKSALFVDYYYCVIPLGFAYLFYILLDSFLKSLYYTIFSIFVYDILLRLCITVLLVVIGFQLISFEAFLILLCVVYFIPVVVLVVYMIQKNQFHLSFSALSIPKRFRKIIVSFSLFSYINSTSALIVTTMDAMMIASILGLKATGIYTTIMFLASALQIPYKSMARISSPIVADYWKERRMVEMNELYKKFSSVNLVIGLVLFLVVWVARVELFHFLPPEFEEGIYVFLFLMIGRLVDMYFGLNGYIFVTSKKYRYDIFFTLFLLVTVLILNIVLIPIYGIVGAAVAACVANVVYNLIRLIFIYKVYDLHPFEKSQFHVLLLFTGVVCLFESCPIYVESDVLGIVLKWMLLGVVFLLPIYYFKMEMQIVRYIDNGFRFVKQRIGNNSKKN